jgi:Ran-binding protein 1
MSEVDSKPDPTSTSEGAEDKETTIPATMEEPTTVEESGNPTEEKTTVEQETDTLSTKTSDNIFSMFGGGPKKEKREEKEEDDGEPSGSLKAQRAEEEVGALYFSCAGLIDSRDPAPPLWQNLTQMTTPVLDFTSDFIAV